MRCRRFLALVLPLLAIAGLAPPAEAAEDPFRQYQWGLDQVRAPAAWSTTRGLDTLVAVIDNGVDLEHPDLRDNLLLPGRDFRGCGVAGCGDGSWEESDDPLAEPRHGTHVAGIVAAIEGNGIGVAGVAPDAKIIPINVFEDSEAQSGDVAAAIDWAVARGADVINLSLGLAPGVSHGFTIIGDLDPMYAAVDRANAAGVVVVAAAGNESFPLCDEPAFYPGVLCVTATDYFEQPGGYGNFPLKGDLLGVAAPGGGVGIIVLCDGGIVSTVPGGTGDEVCYADAEPDAGYDQMTGTSQAAPHVAGVAALLRSMGCDRDSTIEVITSTARLPITGARGTFTPSYGYGIVDAAAAVEAAATSC